MRRVLSLLRSRHHDVTEMLITNASSGPKSGPQAKGFPQKQPVRKQSAFPAAPSPTTPSPAQHQSISTGPPGPTTGSSPGSKPLPQQQKSIRGAGGAQPKQQQHEYHRIANSWNVRRTPADHYPPGTFPRKPQSNTSPTGKKAAPPVASVSDTLPEEYAGVAAQAEKLLQVLKYEESLGFIDAQGSSQEHFSQWTQRALTTLATDLRSVDPACSQRCELLAQGMGRYISMEGATRALAVGEAQIAATDILTALKKLARITAPSTQSSSSSSGSINRSSSSSISESTTAKGTGSSGSNTNGSALAAVQVNDDAVAAAAHEEETGKASPLLEQLSPVVDTSTIVPETGIEPHLHQQQAEQPSSSSEEQEEEYVYMGNRRVKAQTVKFRQQFAQAAASLQASGLEGGNIAELAASGEQRTAMWMALRERRLTASAFSKALGFFKGDRQGLWEEKLGLKPPFAGNEATRWGVQSESLALEAYQRLTGQGVEPCMFQVKHDDAPHGWLGASPDGLIGGLGISTGAGAGLAGAQSELLGGEGTQSIPVDSSVGMLTGQGPGILEIKCPFNKGLVQQAIPPQHAIWYYMPQIQGLMDIFDRDWCNLYVWTPANGSVVFHIKRDREYWRSCFEVLAEFWWAHVVPARQSKEQGKEVEVEGHRPQEQHAATVRLMEWSKRLAVAAPAARFPMIDVGQEELYKKL